MSNRAITAVLDYSMSHTSARLLLIIIADGISKDKGEYPAKVATLMFQANLTRRNVQKRINELIALGELVVYESQHAPSVFMIPLFPGETGYDPKECTDETHICNGKHTPLYISREDVKREEVQSARRRFKKAVQGALKQLSTGVDNSHGDAEGGVGSDAPPRRKRRPPASEATPPRVGSDAHYPLNTPLSYPLSTDGAPHPAKNGREAQR